MSSTNKTTNYELSQFVETDKPAWLTDYNGDMRKLDTALKAVSDVADGASGGISSLTDRMTAAEGAITTNANDIDTLEARADALEAGAQSTAGTIAAIQTEQTAQNLGIEAATELGYNLARPYDSASTYAVGDYVLFQNTLYKCVTAIATGEAFDPTKWLAIKATDEMGVSASIITNNVLTAGTPTSTLTIEGCSINNQQLISISNLHIVSFDVDINASGGGTGTGSFQVKIPITWTGYAPTYSGNKYSLATGNYRNHIVNTASTGEMWMRVVSNIGEITCVIMKNQNSPLSSDLYHFSGLFIFVE